MLLEVTCMCGFQARGSEDEVVDQIQVHGAADHGSASSREQILAMAVPLSGGTPGAADV
jgi:predicted small metal-binding protein